MTKEYQLKEELSLEAFSVDEAVEFELEKGDAGYVIIEMHKAGQ